MTRKENDVSAPIVPLDRDVLVGARGFTLVRLRDGTIRWWAGEVRKIETNTPFEEWSDQGIPQIISAGYTDQSVTLRLTNSGRDDVAGARRTVLALLEQIRAEHP